jgi:hypothetical protein
MNQPPSLERLRERAQECRKSIGPAGEGSVPVDASVVDAYRGRLPELLLQIWSEDGFGIYGDGLLRLVNPSDYSDQLDWWLSSTPLVGLDTYHVIARGPFGHLLVWSERSMYAFRVNIALGTIGASLTKAGAPEPDERKKLIRPATTIYSFGPTRSPELARFDVEAVNGGSLFAQCVQRHGPLVDPTKVYGFAPYLFSGGKEHVDNTAIVDEFVQLDLITQFLDGPIFQDISTFPG